MIETDGSGASAASREEAEGATEHSHRVTEPLRLADFDYELPEELVAQEPIAERDRSRLLHVGADGRLDHRTFRELPELLEPGDLVVRNDTRVFPARLVGRRETGGAVELLLLESLHEGRWRVLARPARKLNEGVRLDFGEGRLAGEVVAVEPDGRRIVAFRHEGDWNTVIDTLGRTPLPPYIDSGQEESERRARYQTVYARERGSVAAPTAGLHFTESVFGALGVRGIETSSLTLHVGYATFEPIRAERLDEHRMGVERFYLPEATLERIARTRERGGRVVAVGTTTVRALESASSPGWHETRLFIAPGFDFRVVDALVTNFHLPKSSLLVLVSAFAGVETIRRAYAEAVRERYRFYSFGDAMLLSRSRG